MTAVLTEHALSHLIPEWYHLVADNACSMGVNECECNVTSIPSHTLLPRYMATSNHQLIATARANRLQGYVMMSYGSTVGRKLSVSVTSGGALLHRQ